VVEINGQRILLAAVDGNVKAVSNKCSHLGLPLVGKTAVFQAEISDGWVGGWAGGRVGGWVCRTSFHLG
jgi:nitrite reductase/ring-hydroxylating ferredoxin subunit